MSSGRIDWCNTDKLPFFPWPEHATCKAHQKEFHCIMALRARPSNKFKTLKLIRGMQIGNSTSYNKAQNFSPRTISKLLCLLRPEAAESWFDRSPYAKSLKGQIFTNESRTVNVNVFFCNSRSNHKKAGIKDTHVMIITPKDLMTLGNTLLSKTGTHIASKELVDEVIKRQSTPVINSNCLTTNNISGPPADITLKRHSQNNLYLKRTWEVSDEAGEE